MKTLKSPLEINCRLQVVRFNQISTMSTAKRQNIALKNSLKWMLVCFTLPKKISTVKTPWSDLVLMIKIGRTDTFYCFLYAHTYSTVRNRHMYPQELT